jgi:hypothetical protein
MSGRSSAREVALAALIAAACGHGGGDVAAPPAEADPAKVTAWAAAMLANAPSPGGAPDCVAANLVGAIGMTQNSLLRLANKPIAADPEHADWINPPALDSAPVRGLLAAPAGSVQARQAAAAILGAAGALVYRVDNVDAPLAIGVKELKIGTIGARLIRYDRRGTPVCVLVFFVQNDRATSQQAIAASDRAIVDPKVAEGLRADLAARYLAAATNPTPAPAPTPP